MTPLSNSSILSLFGLSGTGGGVVGGGGVVREGGEGVLPLFGLLSEYQPPVALAAALDPIVQRLRQRGRQHQGTDSGDKIAASPPAATDCFAAAIVAIDRDANATTTNGGNGAIPATGYATTKSCSHYSTS